MITERLRNLGEYAAAGLFEQPERSLFYRKAVGLRRYYETCALPAYTGGRLYPCGVAEMPEYMENLPIDLNRIQREEPAIGTRIREEFYRYSSSVPKEHTVAGDMFTHSMPNYERVLKEGFASYRQLECGTVSGSLRQSGLRRGRAEALPRRGGCDRPAGRAV